ncbi:MAG: PAS domain S-box protein [Methylocystis sp.]|uniref:PAS domain S-box protein n=1 Tax=Methylocystis sp. TaxID=1911079 RepID=UPI003DA48A3C
MFAETATSALVASMVTRQRPIVSYAIALVSVLLAAWVRWLADGLLGGNIPFLSFFPAVLVSALVGGLWVGVLATALSMVVAGYFFVSPTYEWALTARGVLSLLGFVIVSGSIVLVIVLLRHAIDTIAAQEQNQRSLIESAPNGIVVVGQNGVIMGVNACAERLFGYERTELIGKSVEVLVPEKIASVHVGFRERFQQAPETRPMGAGRDLRARRRDGSEFPVEIGLNPVNWEGRRGVLATVTDITERKQHEERQAILARELEHRVGNMFAVILATIRRTLTRGRSISEAEHILTQRVQLLADAHAVLSESLFKEVSVDRLLANSIGSFSEQVISTGPDIAVKAKAAEALSFIFHELLTNAVKHGALSRPVGIVFVTKAIEREGERELFRFLWRETGGPPIGAVTRQGFGSFILLEFPKQFGGGAKLDYRADGLTYDLSLPVDAIRNDALRTE